MRRRNRCEEDKVTSYNGQNHGDDNCRSAGGLEHPPGRMIALTVAWSSLLLCLSAFSAALRDVPANSCAMTYMWPNYISVPVPHDVWSTRTSYSLYLYREGTQKRRVTGLPVLFIPGNAGSGKQVRSLGSQAHADLQELSKTASGTAVDSELNLPRAPAAELDFWAVDFDEELSALSGGDLRAQAQFVCRTISFILSQYSTPHNGLVLVGHSMGGIVARLAAGPFCEADQDPPHGERARVLAVLTIATPHIGLPAMLDPLLRNMFSAGAEFWRLTFPSGSTDPKMSELVMMSLGGGERDVLVGTERTDVYQLCPPTHCLSVSTTALAGAWLSVDHRASLWCNQVVRVLTSAIRSLATAHDEWGFEWKTSRAAKMEALQRAMLPGPRMLEGLSHSAAHTHSQLQPEVWPEGAGASGVSGRSARDLDAWHVRWISANSSTPGLPAHGSRHKTHEPSHQTHEPSRYLRIPDVEEETIYLWRVPAVASVDGVGGSLVLASSLPLNGGGWRILLCGKEVDTLALHAGAVDVAHACLEASPSRTRQDVTSRAVKLQGGGCHARWNADCVPSDPPKGGLRWVLSVAAHEIRPLQMVCVVGPQKGAGSGWMVGMRLVPPSSSEELSLPLSALFDWSYRHVDEKGMGAWYLPMPALAGSIYPVPATMVLEQTTYDACHAPLFKPVVLQTAEVPWHDGVGEGWARAEVDVGERVDLWHQQRRLPWVSHGAPSAAVILADPRCAYRVRVRGHPFWALALSMRRHIVRLIPLTGAALCLRRIFVRFFHSHTQGQRSLADLSSLMVALWALVLAHPVVVCLFWASCSKCSTFWGCTVGAALVSDMMSEADSAWGASGAWKMGNRDSVNWSHVEHPLVSGFLVAAATALSLVLIAATAAISKLALRLSSGARSSGASRRWGGFAGTVLTAGLAIVHPLLASLMALMYTVSSPLETAQVASCKDVAVDPVDRDGSSTSSPQRSDGAVEACSATRACDAPEAHTLRALSLLSVIVRLPSFVAFARSLAVSAKGHEGRLAVLYQDRLGPSLESLTRGSLGGGVGFAHIVDLLAGVLLAWAARAYCRGQCEMQRRRPTAQCLLESGSRSGSAWDGLLCCSCAFAILLAQEDVYVVSWMLACLATRDAFQVRAEH